MIAQSYSVAGWALIALAAVAFSLGVTAHAGHTWWCDKRRRLNDIKKWGNR